MDKKDIDYGLNDIDINDYKLKKNNNGKIIIPFILFLLLYLSYNYLQKSYNVDKINETSISSNIIEEEKVVLVDSLTVTSDSLIQTPNETDDSKSNNLPTITDVNFLNGKYYVIAGSFSNYNLSLNKANLLNKNGFNALIISPINQNKMYRVAVDVYDELDIAKKNLKSYKEKLNNELWILKH